MKPALAELLHNPLVWRGDQLACIEQIVPSGFIELDRALPGGGWPQNALTELLQDEEGIGELRLLMPALQRLAQAGESIVLVTPPYLPHAPAFAAAGIDPAQVIIVATAEDKHRWWAAEQVLRANSAGALLFWPGSLGEQRLRRLQLAAQEGETLAFVFATTARAAQPSPAPLRIRLSPVGARLRVDVFKRRGGVMSAPLLLDLGTLSFRAQREICTSTSPAESSSRSALLGLTTRKRGLSPVFNRRYPVDGREVQIWNRALARADEVRRVPRPDSRGSRSAAEADVSFVVPAQAGTQ
ncbi:MAG TPA: translesion DNA synthesis-associated protein ImuA [Casimicrobiaceae bacterium]|nr:translesion DNA synthesis-associated protein ImuA [Casimicrobiaceae bacterium]